jgi:HD superfamily phosphohydrolase YqeK
MADKNEKERRKQLMDKLKQEADQDFGNTLPKSREKNYLII